MAPETPSSKVVGTVVCLPVHDLDAALVFYRKVFGVPDLEVSDGIILVELPHLSLFLIEESTFESYSRKAGRGVSYPGAGTGVILSCAIESAQALDGMLEAVASHGGSVVKQAAVEAETGLYIGYFFDPDGHHWELAYSGESR